MKEIEQKEESLNIKPYENNKIEKIREEDKETNVSNIDYNETFDTREKNNTRFYPKIKLDMKKQRFPYCMVWTPLPCITWIFPSIGHVGICTSKGIIYDFAGPYYVSVNEMAFGNPTKYILLDLDSREFDEYDKAIEEGTRDYNNQCYSFCFNNCHSYVARCLNKLKYKGKTGYTMVHVWWLFITKGKFLSWNDFFHVYSGFVIVLIIVLILFILFRH